MSRIAHSEGIVKIKWERMSLSDISSFHEGMEVSSVIARET